MLQDAICGNGICGLYQFAVYGSVSSLGGVERSELYTASCCAARVRKSRSAEHICETWVFQ